MVSYRKRLDREIAAMHASLIYWLRAQWREKPPAMATDASAAAMLIAEMKKLSQRWEKRFDNMAGALAKRFAGSSLSHADGRLRRILRDAGWTVKFKMTPAANDIMRATIDQQVGLIKSIASEHLTEVQGLVMRSVQEGRDLGTLTQQLEKRYEITRRRAELIARDQNNKATAAITRARQQELGLTQAIWKHSGAGKEPRPSHVAFAGGQLGGPVYDVREGWLDPEVKERVWPGTLINCRCTSRTIIPGLS